MNHVRETKRTARCFSNEDTDKLSLYPKDD